MNGEEPLDVTRQWMKKSMLRTSKRTGLIMDHFIDCQLHLSGNRSLPFQFTI